MEVFESEGIGRSNYNRDGEWGLKQYALAENEPDADGQLYNLKNDPGETKNLYFKEENIRKELNTILDQLVSSGRSAPSRD